MKAFEYTAPGTLAEAVALLQEKGPRARPFAGGTDLLVQMRAGRLDLDWLVDVKRVPDVNVLAYDPHQGLTLGAAVPCYRIYEDAAIGRAYPALIDAVRQIGGIQIQGRASVGGNLCNSSPSGDAISALIALSASCLIAGPNGTRRVPVEAFCTGPGRNVLGPAELLVQIAVPPPQPNGGARYLRFTPRNEMDIAVVGVGASVVLDADHRQFVSARVALAAVAPTPVYAEAAGAALAGQPISEESIRRAAELAQAAARPITDMRGTAEYRTYLVGVLTRRALAGAVERAKGGVTGVH
ncbi:MAG: xanthine dehydrogenase family protein subunit M [Chloroflexi bacterium]|nr:xanthine dehydrogenase family protein subunit M [Chloroflexota bacterium]